MLKKRQQFGRYQLVELLAEGGMGSVFRAVITGESGFSKQVALKRLHRNLGADPEFTTRFADEARISSTLEHGNIVQVFDFGEHQGEYFLAMEFVDGPDLRSLLAETPLSISAALFIMAGVCRGVGAAHDRVTDHGPQPVVHRDISPQNVLLTRLGEIKVADFGIAKAAEKAIRTRTGMVIGKCRYMAPEQAAGDAVDPRTDVFSCGALLFELVCGRPLFVEKDNEEVLRQLVLAPIPRAKTFCPELPDEVDQIIARALRRAPEDRFAGGNEMARALEEALYSFKPPFTRDDLAEMVSQLFPRRPTLTGDQTVSGPAFDERALLETVPAPMPSPAAETPLQAVQSGTLGDTESRETNVRQPTPPAGPTRILDRNLKPPPQPRRFPWLPLAIVGLAIGVSVAIGLRQRDAPAPPQVLEAEHLGTPKRTWIKLSTPAPDLVLLVDEQNKVHAPVVVTRGEQPRVAFDGLCSKCTLRSGGGQTEFTIKRN